MATEIGQRALTEAHHNETVVWNTKLNAPEENNEMAWTRLSALFQCTASKNVFYFDWSMVNMTK